MKSQFVRWMDQGRDGTNVKLANCSSGGGEGGGGVSRNSGSISSFGTEGVEHGGLREPRWRARQSIPWKNGCSRRARNAITKNKERHEEGRVCVTCSYPCNHRDDVRDQDASGFQAESEQGLGGAGAGRGALTAAGCPSTSAARHSSLPTREVGAQTKGTGQPQPHTCTHTHTHTHTHMREERERERESEREVERLTGKELVEEGAQGPVVGRRRPPGALQDLGCCVSARGVSRKRPQED